MARLVYFILFMICSDFTLIREDNGKTSGTKLPLSSRIEQGTKLNDDSVPEGVTHLCKDTLKFIDNSSITYSFAVIFMLVQ
jgi:hypothetical protein